MELNEPMGVVCVEDVVRQGRLRWFGHLEHKWESASRKVFVTGSRVNN